VATTAIGTRRLLARHSAWRLSWRRLSHSPAALASTMVLVLLLLAALLAPVLAPYEPAQVSTGAPLEPPGTHHLFGTDRYGRDLLSRILYGARLSLPIGLAAVGFAMVSGSLLGLVTGFAGRWVDDVGSKVIDIMLGFPPIMLALLIIAVLGIGLVNVVLAVGIAGTPRFARIVRGSTIAVRENDYVEAARALGISNTRILFRHILPNVQGPIIVLATLYLGRAILESSALGFLGMGVQPPTPEWGTMLSEGREFMRYAPWLMIFPGLALFVTVVSINLLGDWLREVLDPRLRRRY
jgi:peptide/nickel transport system permease protein